MSLFGLTLGGIRIADDNERQKRRFATNVLFANG